jgi:protein TonB
VTVAAAAPPTAVSDSPPANGSAPRSLGEGFLAPRLADRTCIAESIRLPDRIEGELPRLATVRVAVAPSGEATQVQVLGQVADPRVSEAIRRAVQRCEWIPGADAEGKPATLWVVQPVRFAP